MKRRSQTMITERFTNPILPTLPPLKLTTGPKPVREIQTKSVIKI